MRNGWETEIKYQRVATLAPDVEQPLMIVGPAVYAREDVLLKNWNGEALTFKVNATDDNYAAGILKPLLTDQITAAGDLVFSIADADGGNKVEMTDSAFKSSLDTSGFVDAYNSDVDDSLIVDLPLGDTTVNAYTLLTDATAGKAIDLAITIPSEGTQELTITPHDMSTNEAAFITEITKVSNGDVFACYGGTGYAVVTNVSTTPSSASVTALATAEDGATFAAGTDIVEWSFYSATVVNTDLVVGQSILKIASNTAGGTVNILATSVANFFEMSGVSAPDSFAAQIAKVSVGDSVDYGAGDVYGIVKEVTSTTVIFEAVVPGTLVVSEPEVTWAFYHDYTGASVGQERGARITVSLNANRTGLSGRRTYRSLEDVERDFGPQYYLKNSLVGEHLTLAGITSGWKAAIKAYILPTTTEATGLALTNTVAAHSAAMPKMKSIKAYFIVPVFFKHDDAETPVATTDYDAICAAYRGYAEAMKSPSIKNECMVFISAPTFNEGKGYVGKKNGAGKSCIDIGFDSDTGFPGIVAKPTAYDSEKVILSSYYATAGKGEKAHLYQGSQVSAVIAGEISAKDRRERTTLMPVAGGFFSSVPTTEFYTPDQLESLKNTGWYLLIQDAEGLPVYCYHQKTTTQSHVLAKEELSLVIISDMIAAQIRKDNAKFTNGDKNNRTAITIDNEFTDRFIGLVKQTHQGRGTLYARQELIAGMEFISISISETAKDHIDTKVKIHHLFPVNSGTTTIEIVA